MSFLSQVMRFVFRKPSADVDWTRVDEIEDLIFAGNYGDAMQKLNSVQSQYINSDFSYWYYELLKSRILMESNQLDEVQPVFEKLSSFLTTNEHDVLRSAIDIEKVNLENIKGNFNQALDLINPCFVLLDEINRFYPDHTMKNKARGHNIRAKILNKTGKYSEAVDSLQKSLAEYDRLGKETAKAEVYNDLGISHAQLGHVSESLDDWGMSLKIYSELGNDTQVLKISNNTALVNRNLGNLDQAKEDFEQALEISKRLNIDRYTASILLNLGLTISDMGEITQAIEYYLEALELFQKMQNEPYVALVKLNLGNLYQQMGNYDFAIKYFEEARDIFEKVDSKDNLMIVYTSLGEVMANIGKKEEAYELVKQGLIIGEEIGNPENLIHTLHTLVKIAVELKRNEEAEQYLSKLEKYGAEAESKLAPHLVKLSKAMILLQSDRVVKRAEAQQLLQEIADDEIISVSYTVDALLALGELLLQELKVSGSEEALNEFKELINRLDEVTHSGETTQMLAPTIVEVSILQSKLALIDLKMEEAQQILNEAYDLAKAQRMEILAEQVDAERETIKKDLLKYKKMVETNASLYERLQQTQITDYLKRAEGILKKK